MQVHEKGGVAGDARNKISRFMKDQDQGQNIMGCWGRERSSFPSHHQQSPTDLNSGRRSLDCGVSLSRLGRWEKEIRGAGTLASWRGKAGDGGKLERGAKVLALSSKGGRLLELLRQGEGAALRRSWPKRT